MTKFKKYIDEATTSADIARYDKKIGDKGTTKEDSVKIVLQKESFMKKVKEIANKYELSVERDGNEVTLTGSTEKVRQAEEALKAAGVK